MDDQERARLAEQLLEVVEELLAPGVDRTWDRFLDEHPEPRRARRSRYVTALGRGDSLTAVVTASCSTFVWNGE